MRVVEERLLRWLCGLKQNKVRVPAEIFKKLYPQLLERARRMECPFCGRKFSNRGVLKHHISVTHCVEWRSVVGEVRKLTDLFYASIVKFKSGKYRVRIGRIIIRGDSYEDVLKEFAEMVREW